MLMASFGHSGSQTSQLMHSSVMSRAMVCKEMRKGGPTGTVGGALVRPRRAGKRGDARAAAHAVRRGPKTLLHHIPAGAARGRPNQGRAPCSAGALTRP
ncbi:hypothetical protein GCM10025795_12090 [Verticiella sediminum]